MCGCGGGAINYENVWGNSRIQLRYLPNEHNSVIAYRKYVGVFNIHGEKNENGHFRNQCNGTYMPDRT
jgi:hypothetical protein